MYATVICADRTEILRYQYVQHFPSKHDCQNDGRSTLWTKGDPFPLSSSLGIVHYYISQLGDKDSLF